MSNTMVRLMQGDERFAKVIAKMEAKKAEEAALAAQQAAMQQAAMQPVSSGPNWLLYGGIAVALAVAYYLLSKGK